MSNRLFQSIIHQMKDAVDRVIGVLDENDTIISCSELGKIGENRPNVNSEFSFSAGFLTHGGYTYRAIGSEVKPEYLVFVEGEDKTAEKTSMLSTSGIGSSSSSSLSRRMLIQAMS